MTENWVPFTIGWDDHVPVDISFVFEDEKPAGQHGFLRAEGDRLVFEDGTEGRFWGTCFNSGACFPTHEESEMVARRLAKFGVNMMRTHQMDAEWATPNIFQFNRARPKDNTRSFDPESIDRLDYLIYCLKEQGIYTYLDLLTYRKFRPGDAVDSVDELEQAAKPYTYFDPRMIELQKEFARDLWTHINPYTGLAYCDDPAIALVEIKNESCFRRFPVTVEPYRTRLETMYRAWAEENGRTVEDEPVDFTALTPQEGLFLAEVMKSFFEDMLEYLRADARVKIPITGTNYYWWLGLLYSQKSMDFMDNHSYWNFPLWEPGTTSTTPMVGVTDSTISRLAAMRVLDRPFFVSEWDHAWPDEWRAESSLFYAAVGAFQGWSGFTIHTYRYSTWGPVDRLGGGGQTINGIPYRFHFDAFNDPAKFGLFPHAALMFRRADVRRGDKAAAIKLSDDVESWLLKGRRASRAIDDMPALHLLAEKYRMGVLMPGETSDAEIFFDVDEVSVDPDLGEIISETGEVWRSWKDRVGWVDTARTKVVYGFVGEVEGFSLEGLEIKAKTDFATIALSSLTDAPISESESLLLTAVGRSDNAGAEYDEDHKQQFDVGHAPVLIEPIEAEIALTTSCPHLKVWLISDKGEAVIRLPATYADGVLRFEIGPQPRWNPSTIYYLITL